MKNESDKDFTAVTVIALVLLVLVAMLSYEEPQPEPFKVVEYTNGQGQVCRTQEDTETGLVFPLGCKEQSE